MKHLPLNTAEYQRLYKDFGVFIRQKGYARGKGGGYDSLIREFLFFMENRGVTEVEKVVVADVVQYHEYLKERPNNRRTGGLSDSMIASHIFALKIFFDYLMDMGEVTASPAHLPKMTFKRQNAREILTVEEIKQVFSACETQLEKALITIAYGCGLRRTEISQLDTSDVILHQGVVIVRDGKFNKSRTVPVSDAGVLVLRQYIADERDTLLGSNRTEEKALFINRIGTRISGQDLNDVLKIILNRTQNPAILSKNITLHCLRHSIATHLLDNGAEIEFVQEFLGHAEMDTSTIYSRRRQQRLSIYKEINRPNYGSNDI